MCLLFLYVFYSPHVCLAAMLNPKSWFFVLQVCQILSLAPLTCIFDLHFWILCLVLRVCLAFCCALFVHCFFAPWSCTLILLSCTFNSYYQHKKPCINAFVLHLLLVCLPYDLYHQLLRLSLVLHLCLASLIVFILHSQLECLPLYLASLTFTFVLPFQHLFCTFGVLVLNLHSMCFTTIL